VELESALLITPPRPVQAFAYPIREEYDPESFARVPAHFAYFYPFVPADQSDEAAEVLKPICARHSAFEVTLERYGLFEDAVFFEPSDPEPLVALYDSLAETYAEYASEDFHPHLTLGRAKDPSTIPLPDPPSFTFTVNSIRIYVGSPEDHVASYIPRLTIPLG